MEVEGEQGGGRLRLVLRHGADGYQLLASDPFGRPLWVLTRLAPVTWLVDHRAEAWCRASGAVALPQLELSGLPIDRVPAVLEGEAPAHPPEDAEGERFEDAEGRWWSLREGPEGLAAWTLWSGDEPVLWWQAQPRGGILSHRRGSQFRWRSSVAEETEGSRFAAVVPEGYDRLDCAAWDVLELRQDQPASAGDRPPG
ncbi:MAG: hypothetical protein R3325_11840 [Thermoanaerobaculia bacterium]|nr:hypothetical protein [Thermoanaerobaculia bacterium]